MEKELKKELERKMFPNGKPEHRDRWGDPYHCQVIEGFIDGVRDTFRDLREWFRK